MRCGPAGDVSDRAACRPAPYLCSRASRASSSASRPGYGSPLPWAPTRRSVPPVKTQGQRRGSRYSASRPVRRSSSQRRPDVVQPDVRDVRRPFRNLRLLVGRPVRNGVTDVENGHSARCRSHRSHLIPLDPHRRLAEAAASMLGPHRAARPVADGPCGPAEWAVRGEWWPAARPARQVSARGTGTREGR